MADRPSPLGFFWDKPITFQKMMKHHPTCKFLISGKNPKGCVLIKGSYSHVSQFPLFRTDNPFIKMMDNQAPGIYTVDRNGKPTIVSASRRPFLV